MDIELRTPGEAKRRRSAILLVPLLFVAAGCSSAAGTPSAVASEVAATGSPGAVSGTVAGAPGAASHEAAGGASSLGTTAVGISGSASSGAGIATSNPAIAYPYPVYPGAPGIAPDHTIVVTGVGEATVKADLSDRAGAERSALAAALVDAKAQADIVVRATGVTIVGVLSVSVSDGQAYAMPLLAGVDGSAPGARPDGSVMPLAPIAVAPTTPQLQVSVTVAYRID